MQLCFNSTSLALIDCPWDPSDPRVTAGGPDCAGTLLLSPGVTVRAGWGLRCAALWARAWLVWAGWRGLPMLPCWEAAWIHWRDAQQDTLVE